MRLKKGVLFPLRLARRILPVRVRSRMHFVPIIRAVVRGAPREHRAKLKKLLNKMYYQQGLVGAEFIQLKDLLAQTDSRWMKVQSIHLLEKGADTTITTYWPQKGNRAEV